MECDYKTPRGQVTEVPPCMEQPLRATQVINEKAVIQAMQANESPGFCQDGAGAVVVKQGWGQMGYLCNLQSGLSSRLLY